MDPPLTSRRKHAWYISDRGSHVWERHKKSDLVNVMRSPLRLSLSRLNHWLPGVQAHPEIVQGTAELHHPITDALLPQAAPVLHDAAALDTAVDMRDPQPTLGQRLVGPWLFPGQLLAVWLLGRHEDRHPRQRQGQEAQILSQSAPRKQGRRRRVRHGLLMGAAAIRVAQEEDEKQRVDQQDIFDSVVLFLAALTRAGLVNEGADDFT
jgi:hypothetical protein